MKSVLIVDDDKTFIFLGKKVLEGIKDVDDVRTAHNGMEALGLFNNYYIGDRNPPDYILLDLNMPVLDGYGFLVEFGKLHLPKKESVRIIVVTSSDDPRDIVGVKSMGVDHYLTKPLVRETLRAAMEN